MARDAAGRDRMHIGEKGWIAVDFNAEGEMCIVMSDGDGYTFPQEIDKLNEEDQKDVITYIKTGRNPRPERTHEDFNVIDSAGECLREGVKVKMGGDDDDDLNGVILTITEPDGDADSEGRPIPINPTVKVLWDGEDGDDETMLGERFDTWYQADEDSYVCEDLTRVFFREASIQEPEQKRDSQ